MKKVKYLKILIIIVITIHPVLIYGNNYFRIKYSTDSNTLSYRNAYIGYGLHYCIEERVCLNLNLKKLPDENGYYPIGYIAESNWGFYERGSYSIKFSNIGDFNKIILGNYMPYFGQGLLFGGGYPIFIYNPYYDLGRFRDRIAVSKTYSKSAILEGLALEYSYGDLKIRPFVSWNSYDCSAGESDYYRYNDNDYDGIPNDEDSDDFTNKKDEFLGGYSCKYSLEKAVNDETIYSNDEYSMRRNKLTEYIIGINSSLSSQSYLAGLTFLYSGFNRMIDPYYNFDPEGGYKSSFYFRGKDYIAAEAYFKLKGDINLFTDLVGTFYKSLSYYEQFSGKVVRSFGFTSGVKTKVKKVSLLFWIGYVPANIVNPHGVEYPWGRKNFASMVTSMSFSSNKANFRHWLEASKELFDIDNPGIGEEVDLSYNWNLLYDLSNKLGFELRQKYEAIDNYYYFPDSRSYKIVTKVNIKHKISNHIRLTDLLEYRFGKVEGYGAVGGIGGGGRLTINKGDIQIKGMIFGYITDDSVLASLYPYEPSVYRWSFLPSSLNGRGVLISTSITGDVTNFITAGFKARLKADIKNLSKSNLKFYLVTEIRF